MITPFRGYRIGILAVSLIWFLGVTSGLPPAKASSQTAQFVGAAANSVASGHAPRVSVAHLPLAFEPNRGQVDARVDYLAHAAGFTVFLTRQAAVFATASVSSVAEGSTSSPKILLPHVQQSSYTLRPLGTRAASLRPSHRLPGIVNYLVGSDRRRWHTGIPTFGAVTYTNVYRGIDLVFHGSASRLEYDWIIQTGANPDKIRLAFDGVHHLTLDAQGNLRARSTAGMVEESPPRIYQLIAGRQRRVSGRYIIAPDGAVGFRIGAYNRRQPVVIDPVLTYSTYLGGSGNDLATGVAVGPDGSAYISGYTASTDFPTDAAVQPHAGGNTDAFVARLNAAGSGLIYSTYIGGSEVDVGAAIAVGGQGDAYVVGQTYSVNFPTVNALQGAHGGKQCRTNIGNNATCSDAFLLDLAPTGKTLRYSTYLGGSGGDYAFSVAVDPAGNAYVCGSTYSTDFPTVHPVQRNNRGGDDAFVAKVGPQGTTLLYSTYLGGTGTDNGEAVAIDPSGDAYIAGDTTSPDLPVVSGVQRSFGGHTDAWVAKLDQAGSRLLYATYLGGSRDDVALGIAVDAGGSAYVAGYTDSSNFPTAHRLGARFGDSSCPPGAGPCTEAFVSKLVPNGKSLAFSTYLGRGGESEARNIALDSTDNVYVVGYTRSSTFPTLSPIQTVFGGGTCAESNKSVPCMDGFITELSGDGRQVRYSTFLGGSADDRIIGVAADGRGGAYVVGETTSTNFPTTHGAYRNRPAGGQDAFVAKITAVSLAFSVLAVRAERAGSKPDLELIKPPVTRIAAGSTVFLSIYVDYSVIPPNATAQIRWQVSSRGRTVLTRSTDTHPQVLGTTWDHISFTARRAGTYTFTGAVSINGTTKHKKASFLVQQRVKGTPAQVTFSFDSLSTLNSRHQVVHSFRPGESVTVVLQWTVHNLKGTTPLTVIRTYEIPNGSAWKLLGHPVQETFDTTNGTHRNTFTIVPNPTYAMQRLVVGTTIGAKTERRLVVFHVNS